MGDKNLKHNKPFNGEAIPSRKPDNLPGFKYFLLASIIIITFWCYHYSLGNEFVSWDDERFIPQNTFIKSFSAANLKMMLFHDVTGDYYNPITIISYAINYHFSGVAPQSYYLTDIIIHILNSCLMFFLALMMLEAMKRNGFGIIKRKEWMAFFCTLAFAVHPMHVESVSWVAERKDELYTFFYFAGMMAYIRFTGANTKKYSWLGFVFVCFLLSQLSKPVAIVFPFSLLALDILLKRDRIISLKNIFLEKLPFILVSVLCIITTYHSEKLSGSMEKNHIYSFFQRFLFATYSFDIYVWKAFIPTPQSAYYPYPELDGALGNLPFIYYVSPFIALLVVFAPLYLSCRTFFHGKTLERETADNNFRITLFGLGFYFFNMVMFSKIISSGSYFLADRYTYMCYFGIFFPVTYFINNVIQKGDWIRKVVVTMGSIYIIFLAVLCYQRTYVWHNSETLWTDVINKYPRRISVAYDNLGVYHLYHGDMDEACSDFRESIKLAVHYAEPYRNLGLIMSNNNKLDSALYCYTEAIKDDNNYELAYMDRGIVYSKMGRYDFAMQDYKRALRLDTNSTSLLQNMAFTYLKAGQYDSAISYYTRLIQNNPNLYGYFHFRGISEFYKGDLNPAMNDFMHTLQIAPHDSESMYYLSITYRRIRDFDNALKYAEMAINAQYPVSIEYIKLLKDSLGRR